MYGIEEYGVTADERLKLAAYRAGYRAFNMTTLLSMLGFFVLLALGEDTGAMVLGVVGLVGINLYGYLVGKEGWEEYVREEMEHRPELRRYALKREFRFAIISAIYFGCFSWFMSHHRSVPASIIIGIGYGAFMFFFSWWQRLRPRKERGETPVAS